MNSVMYKYSSVSTGMAGNLRDCSNRISDAITKFDDLVPVGLATPTCG